MRGAQPGKRRYQVNPFVGIQSRCQSCSFVCRVDQAQFIAQPLHTGTGHKNRPFQRVGDFTLDPVGNGGQQTVARSQCFAAGIQYGKAASAIGAFQHAWRETCLADQRGLLVADQRADSDGLAQHGGVGGAEIGCTVLHLRQ